MKTLTLAIFLFIAPWFSTAQEITDTLPGGTDEQLAAQYMQAQDYEKAAFYYEKLFQKKPIDFYYNHLLNAYLMQEDFDAAEKLVKKQVRKNSLAYTYQVDLGYVYKSQGQTDKANKQWKESLDNLQPAVQPVNELANAFLNRKEPQLALDTYRKGRKILNGEYTFSFEIAALLGAQGDDQGMINEYLDVLNESESHVQQVQNNLSRAMMRPEPEPFNQLLRQELLRRTQKQPDRQIFYELLIWYFMQDRDFASALIHAKALDKRMKGDGGRVYSLSRSAVEIKDYDAAVKGFTYLIEKGAHTYYYVPARIEMLQALTKKVTQQGVYQRTDLVLLEQQYLETLKQLGRKPSTAPLIRELAHLHAFYLENTPEAIRLLDEVIAMAGVKETLRAEAKMELADILLMEGDIWESSLLYSQVDKDFKHDPLGDQAKFRNARLSYFTGDFKWAQAQLDVLKGSTSKLIANDALQLSLLISDNSTVDTNTVPLNMYARAELLSYRNKDEQALATLDSINEYFPGHDLADDILFRKAKIMEKKQDHHQAAAYYQKILDAFSYDILADDALFRLAELNHFHFKDTDKARDLYRQLMSDFPGSLYVVEARQRFRELRGDVIN